MKPDHVSLQDKYTLDQGRAFLSGTQALVRLPMIQAKRDKEAGLNTAGFISGYRGSPLGGYDLELGRAKHFLQEHDVHFEPGLNEDLAATAVWGTQQVELSPERTKDGVFAIWYGKGPGVDRSMDALRHGNAAGTSEHGGVLCIAGDDHGAKSSTLPHQADHNFMAMTMPVLYPAGVHEFVEYGLLGFAMSRYSGCWVGFKATSETIETSATVDLAREQRGIILPTDFEMPEGGLGIRWPDPPREVDYRLQRYKGFAALAFARANKIDRVVWDSPNPRFGIMTSGKSYQDVRQALWSLGITEEKAAEIGLRLYKVGMPWPLEPHGARHFCEGLDEVLVVEEKREMIEHQLKWQLFNWRPEVRPTVVGKHDEQERWLLPPENELSVSLIAHVIAERLSKHYDSKTIRQKLDFFKAREISQANFTAPLDRIPYFCSGCPHNTSTKVPEGSRAMAGIGCHYMASMVDMHRPTQFYTQMGAEGTPWIGQCRFTKEKHIFANLGDGTYQHSGVLAIRAAVAADINITYKILYNDAVAMTGGQAVEGGLTVPQIVAQVRAEGVKRVAVLSDDVERTRTTGAIPSDVPLLDRENLSDIQKEFRDVPGVTVIVYDQTCAAEKRRRRKRGLMEDPPKRVFINPAVCEGCGDCSEQSNCVSIEPLETEFGRKRQINQSTCNKDYSCVKGFCPSFVTIEGGDVRKAQIDLDILAGRFDDLPDPHLPHLDDHYNIVVTGIGGTGVLTIGSVLGMAAHLEGRQALISDMAGLAQKGGAVYSHVRIGRDFDTLRSPRILTGGAHLLLACDAVVGVSGAVMETLSEALTSTVVNTHNAPVADFATHPKFDFRSANIHRVLQENTRKDKHYAVAATEISTALMGDSITTNMFMLGFAYQCGLIPLSEQSILEAIRLNGVAVESNSAVFLWGRRSAYNIGRVEEAIHPGGAFEKSTVKSLNEIIEHRVQHLTDYQDKAYGERYRDFVKGVREKVQPLGNAAEPFVQAVARNYAKLLSYKDEYEVARLYTSADFRSRFDQQFENVSGLKVHLAPPLLSRIDPATGRPRKIAFGSWVFSLFKGLQHLKGLRGSVFDPFGYSKERRAERALIKTYEQDIKELLINVSSENIAIATDLASWPDDVRGFGPVKEAAMEIVQNQRHALWAELKEGTSARQVA